MSNDRCVAACLDGLRQLLRYLKPGSPLRRAEVFLRVAEHEPTTLADISRIMGNPPGTIYDDLRALGRIDANGKAGALLISEMPGGPGEPAHRYTLSARGRRVADAIAFHMAATLQEPEEGEDEPLAEYLAAKRHTRG